jgi:nicotinate-nucleotide adenylyltransferase
LADSVLASLPYDRVILVPAFQSPLKDAAGGASPRDRLDMITASIAASPRLIVDDCEMRRQGVSYTIDTVEELAGRYGPRDKIGLIIGDDLAVNFHRWRRAAELASLTDIIVAHRTSSGELPFPFAHKSLANPVVEISSGAVREKILKGGSWEYLVPAGARFVIRDRGLYREAVQESGRAGPECGGATAVRDGQEYNGTEEFWTLAAQVEAELVNLVNYKRFIHSRNTALMAWDMARAYGLDLGKAYLAGIGHDLCKDFPPEELKNLALRDGKSFSGVEKKNPALLHGRAAAVYLRERYHVTDDGVLEAVRLHTLGDKTMGPLAKVIYIADKVEWSRGKLLPLRDRIYSVPIPGLDELFTAALYDNVAYLDSHEMTVSPGTRRLLKLMREKGDP